MRWDRLIFILCYFRFLEKLEAPVEILYIKELKKVEKCWLELVFMDSLRNHYLRNKEAFFIEKTDPSGWKFFAAYSSEFFRSFRKSQAMFPSRVVTNLWFVLHSLSYHEAVLLLHFILAISISMLEI